MNLAQFSRLRQVSRHTPKHFLLEDSQVTVINSIISVSTHPNGGYLSTIMLVVTIVVK